MEQHILLHRPAAAALEIVNVLVSDQRRMRSRAWKLLACLGASLVTACAQAGPAPGGTPHRGVQLHSLWYESSYGDMSRELDFARRAGSSAVRVDVSWGSLLERQRGEFSDGYVRRLDTFVNGANRRGMRVVATIYSTPCWASSAPPSRKQGCRGEHWKRGVQAYPPARMSDFAEITRWITARYGTKLAALEIWNEPNLNDERFWVAPDRPLAYTRLLKAGYRGAKAGDRRIPVLAASLSGSDERYLRSMYRYGAKGHYDGLAIHPYGDRGFADLRALHALQLRNGDRKPIWVTEFGWPTGRDSHWHVSEGEQAANIARAFRELGQLGWVKGALLYNLRDKGTNLYSLEENMGVLRRNYEPKPSFHAMARALRSR